MYLINDCRQQADFIYDHINAAIEVTVPTSIVKVSTSDRPWITPYFKTLISKRGKAFAHGEIAKYRSIRNRVNRIRKSLKKQFFLDKVQKLKSGNPSQWWKNMKSNCRFSRQPSASDCFQKILYQSKPVNSCSLARTINQHLSEVTTYIPVLDQSRLDSLRNSLSPLPACCNVEIDEVWALLKTK